MQHFVHPTSRYYHRILCLQSCPCSSDLGSNKCLDDVGFPIQHLRRSNRPLRLSQEIPRKFLPPWRLHVPSPPKAFVLMIVSSKRIRLERLWRFIRLRSSLKHFWLLWDCSLDLLSSRYNRNGIFPEWDLSCLVDYGLLFSLDLSWFSSLTTGSPLNTISLTSRIVEVVYSAIGALIFSLYIIYDTYNICNVLHPDEYIIGSINLYAILCSWLILVTLISSIYSWIFLEFWMLWIARISWIIKYEIAWVEGKYSKSMFGSFSSRSSCVAWLCCADSRVTQFALGRS